MSGLEFQSISNTVGFLAGLKAFTAAVVGGIGSITGAMVGGIFIGLCESFSLSYISTKYSDLIVFGILIVTMLIRPTGIFGRAGAAEGLTWAPSIERPTDPAVGLGATFRSSSAPIGVDEWVAQSEASAWSWNPPARVLARLDRAGRLVARGWRWSRSQDSRSGCSPATSTCSRSASTACCTRSCRSD